MSLLEARRSLPRDFPILHMAYDIKLQEKEHLLHLGAWLSQSVQATTGSKKNPRNKYRRYDEFYDYGVQFSRALGREGEVKKGLTLADKNRILNKSGRVEVRGRSGRRDIALMNMLLNNRPEEVSR